MTLKRWIWNGALAICIAGGVYLAWMLILTMHTCWIPS
jgi:hypothetical protein